MNNNLSHNFSISAMSFLISASGLICALASASHPNGIDMREPIFASAVLLTFSIAVASVCALFNERSRSMSFRLKEEVAKKNVELEAVSKNLAEFKGQMLQQEKMAAIGTLAVGLLHEINNPVNFCLMAVNVAQESPIAKADPGLNECLTDAKLGMQRIQHIVSDLKVFAYRDPDAAFVMKSFLFEKALESATRLTMYELKGVSMCRDLPNDTLVRGDEAAIVGVLINLFSNAALAMRKARTPKPAIQVSAAWQDGRLHVAVRDNGPGIAPENISRIFEPFFTTREVGQGLGLGLSISHRVIERHGGTLHAESVAGEWTRMSFDLPRAD